MGQEGRYALGLAFAQRRLSVADVEDRKGKEVPTDAAQRGLLDAGQVNCVETEGNDGGHYGGQFSDEMGPAPIWLNPWAHRRLLTALPDASFLRRIVNFRRWRTRKGSSLYHILCPSWMFRHPFAHRALSSFRQVRVPERTGRRRRDGWALSPPPSKVIQKRHPRPWRYARKYSGQDKVQKDSGVCVQPKKKLRPRRPATFGTAISIPATATQHFAISQLTMPRLVLRASGATELVSARVLAGGPHQQWSLLGATDERLALLHPRLSPLALTAFCLPRGRPSTENLLQDPAADIAPSTRWSGKWRMVPPQFARISAALTPAEEWSADPIASNLGASWEPCPLACLGGFCE